MLFSETMQAISSRNMSHYSFFILQSEKKISKQDKNKRSEYTSEKEKRIVVAKEWQGC